jgi:transcription initiation factor TFIID subunit 2
MPSYTMQQEASLTMKPVAFRLRLRNVSACVLQLLLLTLPTVWVKTVEAAGSRSTVPARESEASAANAKVKAVPRDKATISKSHGRKGTNGEPNPVNGDTPYIDDGLHDLYMEVLEMEQEQKSRPRQKDAPITNGTSNKRKVSESEDDDLLALATPAKKERHHPPLPKQPQPIPQPRIIIPANTVKHSPINRPGDPQKPASAASKVTASTVASPIPTASKTSTSEPSMSLNDKKAKDLLRTLMKMPEAFIFLRPVDPVQDGCPTYCDRFFAQCMC